jgi:predicted nuclease of restriction endonuclease-like (RecB) superfamily
MLSFENEDKREFYMAESAKNLWTARELERQINSQLYERLLLSNDKKNCIGSGQKRKVS